MKDKAQDISHYIEIEEGGAASPIRDFRALLRLMTVAYCAVRWEVDLSIAHRWWNPVIQEIFMCSW